MKFRLFLIAFGFLALTSCTKEDPITETPKTPEQLLTAKTWKTDEARIQFNNTTTQYYKRGANGNTVNYDSDSLKFNSNNTGVYYYQGSQYATTWNFTDPGKTKMNLVISFSTAQTLKLENITITKDYFAYAQYPASETGYLASVRRLPN